MVDIEEAKRQCHILISEMADLRSSCDDAGMARRILEDLDRSGQPGSKHRARLTRWCHTTNHLYQRGVPIARAISIALYGRVLPRED
jgi:hypothetical protein